MGEGGIARLLTGSGVRGEIARAQTQAELDEVLDRHAGGYQRLGREADSFTSGLVDGPVQVAVELKEGSHFYFICYLKEGGWPVVVTEGGEEIPFERESLYSIGFTFGRSSQENTLAYPTDPAISRLQTRVYWWPENRQRFEIIDRNTPNGTLWRSVPKSAAERLQQFFKRDVAKAQTEHELLKVLDEHLRPLHQLGGEGNPTHSMPLRDGFQVTLGTKEGLRPHAFICFVARKGFPHVFTPEGEVAHFAKSNGDYVLRFGRDPGNDLVLTQPIASRTHGRVVFDYSKKVFILHDEGSKNHTFYRPLPVLAINRFVELREP